MKLKKQLMIAGLCLAACSLEQISAEAAVQDMSAIPVVTQDFSQRVTSDKGRIKSSAKAVSIRFRRYKYKLKPGQQKRINVTIRPSIVSEKPVFVSERPEIADFINANTILAKQPGTTYITATLSNGKHAKCKIIVKKKNPSKTLN